MLLGDNVVRRKKITTISIEEIIIDHSRKNPQIKSLSDYINEKYKDEFLCLDKERQLLQSQLIDVENTKKRIREIKIIEESSMLSKDAFAWIRDTGVKRSQEPSFKLESILKFFNNEFGLDCTIKQFRIYIERAKNEKH